jgi:hypothetical protein
MTLEVGVFRRGTVSAWLEPSDVPNRVGHTQAAAIWSACRCTPSKGTRKIVRTDVSLTTSTRISGSALDDGPA